jgi:hypothetical protein
MTGTSSFSRLSFRVCRPPRASRGSRSPICSYSWQTKSAIGAPRPGLHAARASASSPEQAILALEGDSHVEWFEGNFEAYEEDKKRRLGVDSLIPHRIKFQKSAR